MKRKTSLKTSSASRLCVLLTQEWFGTGSVGPRKSPSDRLSVQCYEIDRCCLLNYSGEESDAFSIDIDDSDRGYGDVPE